MFRRLLAVGAVLMLVVAGCTGSEDEPSEPDTRTTTGVTDDTVVVVAPSSASPQAIVGAAARFERANTEGGVNGHRIAYQDSVDVSVDDEDAFMRLPATDARGATARVFGAPLDASFCGLDDSFAVNGCQGFPNSVWGTLVALAGDSTERPDDGIKALVVATAESEGGPALDVVVASFEGAGYTVESTVVPDASAGDAGSIAEDLLSSEPSVVAYLVGDEQALAWASALRVAGFKGQQTFRSEYAPSFAAAATNAGLEGISVFTDFAPFESADENPIVQRLIDDVREYEETEGLPETPLSGDVAAGYWAADAFLDVLDATGSDPTVERFLQTANDDFEWRAEGTAGPTTWPRNRDLPVPCGALVEVSGDGTFGVAVGYSCGRNLS